MREIIATGKSVEEATENGCEQLGLGRDEVSVEILEMPVKKLFKTLPAKVKVTSIADAEAQELAAKAEEKAAAEAAKAAAEVASAPVANAVKEAPAKAAAPKAPQAPAPKRERKPVLPTEPEEKIDLAQNPRAKMAVDYLSEILSAMDARDLQIEAFTQGDATLLRVEGDSVTSKMEVRGEVIQALSYLIDRSVNTGVDKKEEGYLRIRLDISGYRNRRESELLELANRTGEEVARTGRSRTLAPMNPYERLIIHTAISSMEGVISESIGADVERRVVVKSTGPNASTGDDWRPPRKDGGGRNGGGRGGAGRGGNSRGGRRDGGGRRDSRPKTGGYDGGRPQSSTPQREYADKERDPNAAPIVPQRRDAIKDGDDLPLYGKIDL